MQWTDVEKAFSRALSLSFSKRKCLLTFPVLSLCGILMIFCKALAFDASDWIAISLRFLPFFLSSGILLALGTLLIRVHYHEAKKLSLSMKKLFTGSSGTLLGTSYLSLPFILSYLCLWMFLGLFFLLKEIPLLGEFFTVIFSFGPFLLLFGSLVLCTLNLLLLFFVTPVAALHSVRNIPLAKKIIFLLKDRILSAMGLFFLALIPLMVVGGLLMLAANLTNLGFSIAERSLSVAMESFFIMLPFTALLTPAIIFFFNFAAESYQLLQIYPLKTSLSSAFKEKKEENFHL